MYLSRLIIKNYRSVRDIDISFSEGKNIIIGRNNSGKSNIIKAIDIVLGESSPTYNKSENITLADFYTEKKTEGKEEKLFVATDIFITCFLNRKEGEELDFDAINKCMGYFKQLTSYHGSEKRVEIDDFEKEENLRKIFVLNHECQDSGSPACVPGKHWIDSKLKNQIKFKDELENKYEFVLVFNAHRDEDAIDKNIRFLYREDDSKDWVIGFSAPVRNEFLQSAIIPAFRDPDSQLRLSSWTWYGKLMKALTSGEHRELRKAFDNVAEESNKIFSSIQEKIKTESFDIAFPGAKIYFQFSDDKKQDVYKNTKIYVDDGIKTALTEKGAGIQSATIIGLFNYYTKNVSTKTSALLCVEEPELYLHPHARRVISDRLDEFTKDDGGLQKHQVILSTHSSEFIRTTDETMNIVLVKKDKGETVGSRIKIKELKKLLLDERYNEAFFADNVILCEGLDGYLLSWASEELFPGKLNSENTSILNVGSKDNIPEFVDLIMGAGIKCYIFTDFDFLLRDNENECEQYGAKHHKSILDIKLDFFSQDSIFGENASAKVAKIKELREYLKKNSKNLFYTAKSADQFSGAESIKKTTKNLRKVGIGILDGEIESLSKDEQILKSLEIKLSLDKVFQINREINAGRKISDIVNVEEIKEFLSKIFT